MDRAGARTELLLSCLPVQLPVLGNSTKRMDEGDDDDGGRRRKDCHNGMKFSKALGHAHVFAVEVL